VALAEAARDRGAMVCLVLAAAEVPPPVGVEVVRVESALDMREAMHAQAGEADVVVMAAAVADFRPERSADSKIKKTDGDEGLTLALVRNPDILLELVAARRPRQTVVGFAAETGDADGDPLDHARRKLARKGVDLLVLNDVSGGRVFGRDTTAVTLLRPDGMVRDVPPGDKRGAADAVWDAVVAIRREWDPA
jgi:phosphopantothenoylcysteine decarboxylase/phosphopantothenate--cysteine ligase